MTPKDQLPPLPEPDTHCFDDDTGKDVWSYSADQMHAYALSALAQQAQGEPVVWLMQAIGTSQFEFARPNQKAMHPHMWTDAFPVYRTTPQPAPQATKGKP